MRIRRGNVSRNLESSSLVSVAIMLYEKFYVTFFWLTFLKGKIIIIIQGDAIQFYFIV